MQFFALTKYTVVAAFLAVVGNASPTPVTEGERAPTTIIESNAAEFDHWLATTAANITWVGGKAPNRLTPRASLDTSIAYCTQVVDNRCQGYCSFFTGSGVCVNTVVPAACIHASNNVAYCNVHDCTGNCAFTANCWRIQDSFCWSQGLPINSIQLP